MHPFPPAAAGGTLRGVPYRASPLGGKVSGALWVFLRAAARTCWVCPAGRVGGAAGVGYPKGGFPYPKAFPSGGRCSSAHTGADEGAIQYPTFPCRNKKRGAPACRLNGIFLLLRWASRSPPHPSPSVTASPQGEAFVGGMPPQRKAFSPNPCSRKMRIQIRARAWAP